MENYTVLHRVRFLLERLKYSFVLHKTALTELKFNDIGCQKPFLSNSWRHINMKRKVIFSLIETTEISDSDTSSNSNISELNFTENIWTDEDDDDMLFFPLIKYLISEKRESSKLFGTCRILDRFRIQRTFATIKKNNLSVNS